MKSKRFVNLERVLMGCNRKGSRYLQHDVYYTPGKEDRPVLLARRYDNVDDEMQKRLSALIKFNDLYATRGDYRDRYMGRRCPKCDRVVTVDAENCWSCEEKLWDAKIVRL